MGALRINEHFIGRFSTYRNTNPLTDTDWEGVGITPDHPASLDERLSVAIRIAGETMAQRTQQQAPS